MAEPDICTYLIQKGGYTTTVSEAFDCISSYQEYRNSFIQSAKKVIISDHLFWFSLTPHLFIFPNLLQDYSRSLPGILNDLSGSHLDMAQGIIFPNLPDVLQIKILTHYRFRHRHHLLPEVRRADKSADPYSLPMS